MDDLRRPVAPTAALTACLNGSRPTGVPVTAQELASAARDAVRAGASEVHIHPRDIQGRDSVDPIHVAEAVAAVRAAVPGVAVGVTTAQSAGGGGVRRAAQVGGWQVLPDVASVNWHEDGARDLAWALLQRGVAVEAGLWTVSAARSFLRSDLVERCRRILLEPMEQALHVATDNAEQMLAEVSRCGLPVLLHGIDSTAWPLLRAAAARGLQARIGLEDVLTLPDDPHTGHSVRNSDLVAAAAAVLRLTGRADRRAGSLRGEVSGR